MEQPYSPASDLNREVSNDLQMAEKAQVVAGALFGLHANLSESSDYTLDNAFALESLVSGVGLDVYYSAAAKVEKKQIALEGIVSSIKDTIIRGLKYIVNLIGKFVNWLRGKSNGGMTKQSADWFEKTIDDVMRESTGLITLGFHVDIKKVVEKDYHLNYFRKLSVEMLSIFNDANWAKLHKRLSDYLVKGHFIKELMDHAANADKWHSQAFAKYGKEDAPVTEEFKRQMTGETSHIATSVAVINDELKRMYEEVKEQPRSGEGVMNHLSIDAVSNLNTAHHAVKRIDFADIAVSREGELRSLLKIKHQCEMLRYALSGDEERGMTARGWYIYSLHQKVLMGLTNAISILASCYDALESYFRLCVRLFIFCQDYYIDTHALLVRAGNSEDGQVKVHMLKMTGYRDQLKKLLNTPNIRFS